jgi:hypothetical protein
MTISNPISDFSRNTLGGLRSLWAKLAYMAGLRDSSGSYHHWGMEQKYGEESAREAIRTLHRQVTVEMMRTPTAELWQQLADELSDPSLTDADYEELLQRTKELLPAGSTPATEEHFTLLIHVMNALRSRYATGRAA